MYYDPNFNCLENCDSCSIETCGTFKISEKSPEETPQKPEKSKSSAVLTFNNFTSNENETNQNNSQQITIETNSQEINIDTNNQEISIGFRSGSKEGSSTSDSIVDKPEVLYCDDISDSEDEMDFQMFHSDVTDAGVQWFGTHDPQSVDVLGNESVLFRKPHKKCHCDRKSKKNTPVLDISEPGLLIFFYCTVLFILHPL